MEHCYKTQQTIQYVALGWRVVPSGVFTRQLGGFLSYLVNMSMKKEQMSGKSSTRETLWLAQLPENRPPKQSLDQETGDGLTA